MDFRLLESFRAVMDTQSVTQAAEILGVTQPAVSAHIARLEADVGFALFERVGRRLKPSPKGRQFFAEVRDALGTLDRLSEAARSIRDGSTESLTVASHPSASISILPHAVAELYDRWPDARVKMINRTSEEVRAIFERGIADIGIAEWPTHIPAVEHRRYDVDCVAILPRKHPLATESEITPEMLAQGPFIAMPETRLIGHRIRQAFGDTGQPFSPVAESEYFSTICALVAAGAGAGVVDGWSAATFKNNGLEVRPFVPQIRYEIGVFFTRSPGPGALASELLDLVDKRLARSAGDARQSDTPQ
jgi:DNA-binding transcriptional LysR family regulator